VKVDEMVLLYKLKVHTMAKTMVKLTSTEKWLNSSAQIWLNLLQQGSGQSRFNKKVVKFISAEKRLNPHQRKNG